MKNIFKIAFFLTALFSFERINAQVVSVIPEDPDVTDTITIVVDLALANYGDRPPLTDFLSEDMYIWTWSPTEHPANHPLVNGIGSQAWKNSNDALKMDVPDPDKPNIRTFTMVPTVFYEVPAADVYTKGIKFLVKLKDGGGFGDPDYKTDDLELIIEPPTRIVRSTEFFPSVVQSNRPLLIEYDQNLENNEQMKAAPSGEIMLWLEAQVKLNPSDTTTTGISRISYFNLQNAFPEFTMRELGGKKYNYALIPDIFFDKPNRFPNGNIEAIRVIIRSRQGFGAVRGEVELNIPVGCQ